MNTALFYIVLACVGWMFCGLLAIGLAFILDKRWYSNKIPALFKPRKLRKIEILAYCIAGPFALWQVISHNWKRKSEWGL